MGDEIIKVIDKLCQQFGIAIDWTDQNVLPYLQELAYRYVHYKIVFYSIWAIIGLILVIISIVICKKFFGKSENKQYEYDFFYEEFYDDHECLCTVLCIVAIILFIIGLAIVIPMIFYIAQCITIPEKLIFDYVSSLLK